MAVGVDPFRLVRRLVHESTERIRAQLGASDGEATGAATGGTEDKGGAAAAASFVDKFGWCTWDSFYTMVTPEGVVWCGVVCMCILWSFFSADPCQPELRAL